MSSVLEQLQQTTDAAEIWWDSSPLDFPAWRDDLLSTAPDPGTRERWAEELSRFLAPEDPGRSLVRGVTTNPSLVARSVLSSPGRWSDRVQQLLRDGTAPDVESVYRALYRDVLQRSAAEMVPTWQKSEGAYGWISGQVDPRGTFDAEQMLEEALQFIALAPNLMVKVPGSEQGYEVIEELVSLGVSVNSTLSYTVPQFMACAGAVERGLERARVRGMTTPRWRAVFTHMIGRFGDNADLRYEAAARGITLSPTDLRWAELAIVKRIDAIVRERSLPVKPLLSSLLADDPLIGSTTLSMHLEQTAGGAVAYTCKPQFIADVMRRGDEFTGFRPRAIDEDVPADVLNRLNRLPSFRQAYEPDGMAPKEFGSYGCFISTYAEVMQNTRKLIDFVAQQVHELETPLLATAGR